MAKVTVEGVEAVKQLFNQLEHTLSPRELVSIMRGAGREVVKASRTVVPLEGQLKQATKRDISIVKARVVRGQAEVNVGLKFGYYDINDQVQKVAPIVRHYTEGFTQTDRSGDGKRRGRVRSRTMDFIERGFEISKQAQMAGINKEIDKKIARLK